MNFQYFCIIMFLWILEKDSTKFGVDHTRIGSDIIKIEFAENSPRG